VEAFHWRGGCGHGGIRTNTHNEVVSMVRTIMHYGGFNTRTEEPHLFSDGKKGDLTVRGFDGYHQPLVLDVRITSAVPTSGGTISARKAANPNYPDEKLDKQVRVKERKYAAEAREANLAFVPLVIDVSGRMHSGFKKILETAIRAASEIRNIPFSVLKHYWFAALSFTLHNAQTRGIETMKHKVLGRQFVSTFETSDPVVGRSSFVVTRV